MKEILENTTITYSDGFKEKFDAIRITEGGVVIVRIFEDNGKKEYLDCGYISKDSIKKIVDGKNRKMNIF